MDIELNDPLKSLLDQFSEAFCLEIKNSRNISPTEIIDFLSLTLIRLVSEEFNFASLPSYFYVNASIIVDAFWRPWYDPSGG
jgi:hypothetical protein